MKLKQLFCEHKYILKSVLNATYELDDGKMEDVPVELYECKKCGKRLILRYNSCFYTDKFIEKLKLWQKDEIDISCFDY